jgi:MYXO-CTERM domain-containing protein
VGHQTYTTSRTTATLPSGQFALYDFSSQQRFDNVRLYGALGNTEVPEPGAVAMAVGMAGLGGLLFVRRRNR